MKKYKLVIVLLSAIATAAWVTPVIADPSDDTKTEEKDLKNHALSGKVESVDATAKTLTIDRKIYAVTDTTRITKAGKTVALGELAVGDEVRGKIREVDGKTEVVSLMVSPKKSKDS